MAYSEKILERFENPTHAGTLDKNDPHVGTGLRGAPACGDVLRVQIEVDPSTETISRARWKGFGCGALISSSQLTCEMLEGLSLDEADGIKNTDIAEELCLPPVKIHCSLLAEDSIKAAIQDFRAKQSARDELNNTDAPSDRSA